MKERKLKIYQRKQVENSRKADIDATTGKEKRKKRKTNRRKVKKHTQA